MSSDIKELIGTARKYADVIDAIVHVIRAAAGEEGK